MKTNLIKNQLKGFMQYMIIDKGISQITASGYCRSLSIAIRRMRKLVPKYENIKELLLCMHSKEYSYSHIVNTSLAIEHYCAYKGVLVKLGRPKKPRRIIKNTLTESEVSRMIQVANTARKKAIICLLAYSGIRNKEIRNLWVSDVDLGRNELIIRDGKGRKDRIVNISSDCVKILISYLRYHRKDDDSFLFTTIRRKKQLQSQDIRKIIKVLAIKADIKKRVYPHLLRHSLATNFLKRGASLIFIQQQLGHAFIESTMIYVNSNPYYNKSEYEYHKPAYM